LTAWRLFVAAVVPTDAAAHVWQALAEVRPRHPEVRWISPEQMHLTLLFLGLTDPSFVPVVRRAVAEAGAAHAPAAVATSGVGGRVGGRRGGVAWLRLDGPGVDVLSHLSVELDAALPGARRGRINRPHLTIARRVGESALADLSAPSVHFTIDRIALFRSHADRQGARYESLATCELRVDVDAGADRP
jgi:RNA 2',3'-cyclic 3'-phosphodiesterase